MLSAAGGFAMAISLKQAQGMHPVNRRNFIEKILVGAGIFSSAVIAGTVGSVVVKDDSGAAGGGTGPDHNNADSHSAATIGPADAQAPSAAEEMTADEMDAMHKKGVEDFLKNQKTPITKGKGNQPLESKVENGVRVFNLTVDDVKWEVAPEKTSDAHGYNKMLPGPVIRATEGETVRIVVKNNLKESTAVHWHGLYVPNNMDGVPYVNQDPIKPGATFTYEFTLRNAGTHMYHSHHNSMDQVNRGLLGVFIVDPKDPSTYPQYDREYLFVLNDLNLGFTINGKGFPATDAFTAKKGERVLIRYLNEGVMNHPVHLHGMAMQVFARDGYALPQPYTCDTLDVAAGQRFDVIVEATEPGAWAFHCHNLTHAEGPRGMFGMVTALIVE
jgi:FtsP/CotA-like multicopper oxidase with cupredoxin domain